MEMTKKLAKEIITEVLTKGEKVASVTVVDNTSAIVIVVCDCLVYQYYIDLNIKYLSRQFLSNVKIFEVNDWSDMIHWYRYTNN